MRASATALFTLFCFPKMSMPTLPYLLIVAVVPSSTPADASIAYSKSLDASALRTAKMIAS